MAASVPPRQSGIKRCTMIDGEISLKVIESFTRDAGKGLARLDPADMARLGVNSGDIVSVTGKRTTVAKIMPVLSEYRGRCIIQICGVTRKNAGVTVGDTVTISKMDAKPATAIVLSPGQVTRRELRFINRLLDGYAIVKGDIMRLSFLGSRYMEYTVLDTRPEGPVVINPRTYIHFEKVEETKDRPSERITYEDIGGVGRELTKIREMIELPLKYPELFERAGIEPPKGILMYGPPGTGKTLIARAVASETSAFFMHVNGPEIMHKFYGESEAKLREVFKEAAKNAPSILFIDELDVIAPRRERVVGEVEKRVVGQLLALMDGIKSRGHVVIIGATNIPDALDPALRRPGRFDRELHISIPDKNGRREILGIHTRGMPLAPDVDVDYLADITHGYVGADLAALCREAAMNAIRKLIPLIDINEKEVPRDLLLDIKVSMDDFNDAYSEIIPSTTREVYIETPNVRWDDIGGLENVKQHLIKAIEWPLKYSGLFTYANAKPPKGILMYGPPGTGKTLMAKAVATESKANFISVKGPELLSKWVGESERGIREVFRKARQAAPCIIFFDEIDAIAPIRGSGGDTQVTERTVSQLLTEMDGIEELKGVTVLGATNRLDMIDTAMLRPGRFDILVEVPAPDKEGLLEILKVHIKGKPVAPRLELKDIVEKMNGFTGADVASICREAAMLAIKEYIDKKGNLEEPKFKINRKHFEKAIDTYRIMYDLRKA